MMNVVLQDSTFRHLRDFIYERSGIFIPDTKRYLLEKKLADRLMELRLHSFDEYLPLLRADGGEVGKCFDAITTKETYFFREPHQLAVFADTIAPQIVQRKGAAAIRLWSAACSSGEEPYSLVMLLQERTPPLRAEVVASDISAGVLECARAGVYGSYSTRNVSERIIGKYFTPNGSGHEISRSVRANVRFMQVNIMEERAVKSVPASDVIFCRNVLIYFDEKAKKKAVSLLYDNLRPGGYLFIGTSESLHAVTRAFRPVAFSKVVVYQKE